MGSLSHHSQQHRVQGAETDLNQVSIRDAAFAFSLKANTHWTAKRAKRWWSSYLHVIVYCFLHHSKPNPNSCCQSTYSGCALWPAQSPLLRGGDFSPRVEQASTVTQHLSCLTLILQKKSKSFVTANTRPSRASHPPKHQDVSNVLPNRPCSFGHINVPLNLVVSSPPHMPSNTQSNTPWDTCSTSTCSTHEVYCISSSCLGLVPSSQPRHCNL